MVRASVSVDEGRRAMDDATRTAEGCVGDRVADGSRDERAITTASPRSPAPLRYRDRERYDVRGEQGRGGLGLVLRAHDRELGRDVAVKELLTRGNSSELRFFREALITSRLEHPGIVPVHEAGRWSDGTPFYTMKLVGGRSLHELLAQQRTLEGRLAFLPNVIAVADAIAYAHDRGVIHRDLKPSNVMVGDFGETIVIDWGLAKVLDDSETTDDDDLPYRSPARNDLTAVGSVLGTPAYMAPEQYVGRADHRSDIYALGGILHQLLAGRPPHERSAKVEFSAPDLEYARKTPADLIAIVTRALARDPAKRYQTARAFADDLKRYTRRDRVVARRYSIVARLALAFARHRTVALVMIAALVALTMTFGVSLINIREERAVAIAAREVAVVNGAAAMLERDPTRALEALGSVSASASSPLLRARIRAAGVADRTIRVPGGFEGLRILSSGHRVVISTRERRLHVLDTRTGVLVELADGLTEPAVWAATDDDVYYVRQTSHLSIASVSIDGGAVAELAVIHGVPRSIQANADGTYWRDADGTLRHVARGQAARVVQTDIDRFILLGSQLVTCSRKVLRLGTSEHKLSPIGTCDPTGAWSVIPEGFAHVSGDTLYIYLAGELRTYALPQPDTFLYAQLTSTGLVGGIAMNGDPVVLRAGEAAIEHVRLAGRVEIPTAFGRLAAWALADGAVEVFDTVDGRHWSLRATPGQSHCLSFLTSTRLMTCGRNEIRLWTLPPDAPKILATLPALANNVVLDGLGNALFDGLDGHAYVVSRGEKQPRSIHRHDALSFGVAWCDGEACSAGWDGRVLCTDIHTGRSRLIANFASVAPWLAQAAGHCYTAAASGGIYDVRSPNVALYEHSHEPYRLAVSQDGRYVVSGDWGGELVVYDTRRSAVAATLERAHSGRVTNVAWVDGNIVSSGSDGVLRLWTSSLAELRAWRLGAAVRFMRVANGTIGATLEDDSVWMISARALFSHHVKIGTLLTSLTVSPDGRFLAAGTNDGDVVVISADERAAAAGFEHGRISCLGFDANTSIVACTPSGRVMHVPLSGLEFQSK
jgi:prepilin-type processing-associated H-X9-DG protein